MSGTKYEVYDISGVDLSNFEAMGTKSKFWYRTDQGDFRLFKATVAIDKNKHEIQRYGEDWAEKIVCEIAKLLNIPCANYELAIKDGQVGVISDNFVEHGHEMVHGNQIISHILKIATKREVEIHFKNHLLSRVIVSLQHVVKNKPMNWNSLPDIKTAFDVFCGYLMLDALVSNQDRHDENWGMIVSEQGKVHLAPTYDHAASLARNESDDKRLARLKSKDQGQRIETYVKRAKSQILDVKGKRLKTLGAFEASGYINPKAALSWLAILEHTPENAFYDIICNIPDDRMSEVAKRFTYELVKANRINLLKEKDFLLQRMTELET